MSASSAVKFDPTNGTHLEAFRSLVIGIENEHGVKVFKQHESLRFILEQPFIDIRSMMMVRVAEQYLKNFDQGSQLS